MTSASARHSPPGLPAGEREAWGFYLASASYPSVTQSGHGYHQQLWSKPVISNITSPCILKHCVSDSLFFIIITTGLVLLVFLSMHHMGADCLLCRVLIKTEKSRHTAAYWEGSTHSRSVLETEDYTTPTGNIFSATHRKKRFFGKHLKTRPKRYSLENAIYYSSRIFFFLKRHNLIFYQK